MKEFTELRGFGFNFLTLMFFVTLFFTFLQAYALIMQRNRIVKNKSGKSVSFVFFSYYTFATLAIIIYGLYKSSLALTINGFLGFFSLSIIINILKFKKVPIKEKIIGLLSFSAIPLVILVPKKDLLFFIFGLIVQLSTLSQILELYRNKNNGSIHPSQAIASILSGIFWLIYSLLVVIWPLIVINIIGITQWIILLFFYLKFKRQTVS